MPQRMMELWVHNHAQVHRFIISVTAMMMMTAMMMIAPVYLSVSVEWWEGASEEELIYTEDAGQGRGQKQNITGRKNNKVLLLKLRGAF